MVARTEVCYAEEMPSVFVSHSHDPANPEHSLRSHQRCSWYGDKEHLA